MKRTAFGIALLLLSVLLLLLSPVFSGRRGVQPVYFRAAGYGAVDASPIQMGPGGTIDPNEAEMDELCDLTGVGETLAGAIIDEREKNGPFHYPEDLLSVKGIGEKKLAAMMDDLDFSTQER